MGVKGGDANFENGAIGAARRVKQSKREGEWNTVKVAHEIAGRMGLKPEWTGTGWKVRVPAHMPSGGVGDGK